VVEIYLPIAYNAFHIVCIIPYHRDIYKIVTVIGFSHFNSYSRCNFCVCIIKF
jgi:hypothetical protein